MIASTACDNSSIGSASQGHLNAENLTRILRRYAGWDGALQGKLRRLCPLRRHLAQPRSDGASRRDAGGDEASRACGPRRRRQEPIRTIPCGASRRWIISAAGVSAGTSFQAICAENTAHWVSIRSSTTSATTRPTNTWRSATRYGTEFNPVPFALTGRPAPSRIPPKSTSLTSLESTIVATPFRPPCIGAGATGAVSGGIIGARTEIRAQAQRRRLLDPGAWCRRDEVFHRQAECLVGG